jgi:hypothetical protein
MIRARASFIAFGIAALVTLATPLWLLWPPRITNEQLEPAKVTPLQIARVASLDSVLKAPLFNAERTPPPSPGALVAATIMSAPSSPPPQLVGTIAGGKSGGVVLVKGASGETATIGIGSEVDGWRLLRIGNGSADFQQGERRETIVLDFSNKMVGDGTSTTITGSVPSNTVDQVPAGLTPPADKSNTLPQGTPR